MQSCKEQGRKTLKLRFHILMAVNPSAVAKDQCSEVSVV